MIKALTCSICELRGTKSCPTYVLGSAAHFKVNPTEPPVAQAATGALEWQPAEGFSLQFQVSWEQGQRGYM